MFGSLKDSNEDDWYLRHSALLNRCNVSPWALASQTFQEHPRPVDIAWVRQEHRPFFTAVAQLNDPVKRANAFHEYALRCFWQYEDPAAWPTEAERRKRSYVSVLRGWGIDSSGSSGAVFKGWAENRFGLRAIYHGGTLQDPVTDERYHSERMRGGLVGIGVQLDLLYTYCQDELLRRQPSQRILTLFRGTHDPEACTVKNVSFPNRDQLVEFNTVSSFTTDPEIAWEFGSQVWRVQVPIEKIVYFSGLLASNLLQGECEYIVLGGDYRVTPLRC